MARVTIEAEYAARHCKARLAEIDKQYEEDRTAWFAEQRTRKRKRGVWPFRYAYYPTEGELECAFCGADNDKWEWWCAESRLRDRSTGERNILNRIIKAAEVAADAKLDRGGDGKVTLSSDEAVRFHKLISTQVGASA